MGSSFAARMADFRPDTIGHIPVPPGVWPHEPAAPAVQQAHRIREWAQANPLRRASAIARLEALAHRTEDPAARAEVTNVTETVRRWNP